jgi:hypothetical protein
MESLEGAGGNPLALYRSSINLCFFGGWDMVIGGWVWPQECGVLTFHPRGKVE